MKFFKSKWFKFCIFIAIAVCLFSIFGLKEDKPISYRTADVTRGNIETVVEGNGTITSSESRKVISKVSSEVLQVLHKEGEYVNSGDVIALLDSSSYDATVNSQKIAIEQSKLSINNIQKQINDLTIVANSSGYVSNLTISEGSYVTNTMQICNILESGAYEIILPFVYSEISPIQVGSSAKIILMQNFGELEGTVTKVSEMRNLATASSQVVDVTIKVNTSGYSLAGATAKGEVMMNGSRLASTSTGTFTVVNSNIVRAKSTGTVTALNVYNGKFVNAGDVIAVLTNDDLKISLENARLTLENLNTQYNSIKDQLDNYTITAPISGTITAQNLSVGDMVAAGTLLTTISNKDVLEFVVPIDELDISNLDYDKEVRVSIDAIEDTINNPIQGKISKLPLEGISTAGVTEYYVTIQLPGRDDIRISMNANAKIIVESKKDVLMVPIDAINKDNGASYVTVLLVDGTIDERIVETGARNISYIEIKDGLVEGEKVVVPEVNNGFIF